MARVSERIRHFPMPAVMPTVVLLCHNRTEMTALVRTPLAVTRTLLQPCLILCMEHVMTNGPPALMRQR